MAASRQLFDEDGHDEAASPVTVALFHHPPEWLNDCECDTYGDRQSTLKRLCLRSHIILNGHVHARPSEPARLFNRTWLVKGGASYAEHAYRNHFSILRIDTENRSFERLTYEFDPGKNKWLKDMEDTPFYDLKKNRKTESGSGEKSDAHYVVENSDYETLNRFDNHPVVIVSWGTP